jgi:hypothetical protein
MKYTKVDNKLIAMFDVVRFITANEDNRFNLSILDGVDDYRIILTHGVIGELLMVIENNYSYIILYQTALISQARGQKKQLTILIV